MLQSLGLSDEVAMSGVVSGAHYSFAADGKLLGQYGRAVYAVDDRRHDSSVGGDAHGDVSRSSGLQESDGDYDNAIEGRDDDSDIGSRSSVSNRAYSPSSQGRSIDRVVSKKTRFNVHIPRQKLREIMLRHIDPDKIVWGKQMKHFEVLSSSSSSSPSSSCIYDNTPLSPTDGIDIDDDRYNTSSTNGYTKASSSSPSPPHHDDDHERIVRAHFVDGSYEDMLCLVGADGIYSVVRKQMQQQQLSGQQQQDDDDDDDLHDSHDAMSIHNLNVCKSDINHIQSSSSSSSSSSLWKEESALSYLGFMVILGISKNIIGTRSSNSGSISSSGSNSSILSPQISDDTVIRYSQCQWLNGSTRVFSMPYDKHHTMWQLSYPLSESSALLLSASNKSSNKNGAGDGVAGSSSLGNEKCLI